MAGETVYCVLGSMELEPEPGFDDPEPSLSDSSRTFGVTTSRWLAADGPLFALDDFLLFALEGALPAEEPVARAAVAFLLELDAFLPVVAAAVLCSRASVGETVAVAAPVRLTALSVTTVGMARTGGRCVVAATPNATVPRIRTTAAAIPMRAVMLNSCVRSRGRGATLLFPGPASRVPRGVANPSGP